MAIEACYVAFAVAFFSFLFLCRRNWKRISPFRTSWPVVGMLPMLLHNFDRIHDFATRLLARNGGTIRFKGPWSSNFSFVVTSDPMNVHHIFTKNFENYSRGPEWKDILEPLGDGILNVDGEFWKSQRKMVHSFLNHSEFQLALRKALYRKIEEGLIPILDHSLKLGVVVDMQDVLQRFLFDNICQLVLGFDPKCLSLDSPRVSYEKAFDEMEEALFYRHIVPKGLWKLQKWLQIGEEKKLRRAVETLDKFLYECISLKRGKLSRENSLTQAEEFDLITAYMAETELDAGAKKSDRFMRDIALSMLIAGRDTTSASLSWFLWLVATHPSVEEKILEEIKANLLDGVDDRKLRISNVEKMSRLVYLHGAVCESLRLYPAVPFEHRHSVQPDVLPSGHHVDKSTRILLALYSMGRSKKLWGNDCMEFKPERWITEKGEIIHVPFYKFVAFLSGPKMCLGKHIALLQMKMMATSILWNYCIEVMEDPPVAPSLSVFLKMKHGLHVKLTRRHD